MTLTASDAVHSPLAQPESASPMPFPRRWLGLFAILAATLMNLLDAGIVNVALPAMRRDLGGSYATMQWIAAAYTLVLAIGLLTGGRLGDMFGRRRILLAGCVGFILASVACSVAMSPETLIGARMLQAAFAAVMVPQTFGLIRDLFPGDDQAKAWGLFGPSIGLATILGPIIAGLLIKADLFGTGWRMIFLINVPLGAFALIAGIVALPHSAGDRTGGLDIVGMVLAGTGMGMLIYPLVQGRELGWPAWSFVMLAAAVLVLVVFVRHQLGRVRAGKTPLVQLSVFGRRSFSAGVLFEIFFFIAIVGFSLGLGFIMGEIRDNEVGSASGSLESIQQLSAALGVAVLGTVFFNRFTHAGSPRHTALAAMDQVTVIAIGLTAIAFLLAFLLPKKARA